MTDQRVAIARALFDAYATGERAALDEHLAPELTFFSPADLGIDLAAYWERCWPGHTRIAAFRFERLFAVCDEVVVTYEAEKVDGGRFRNTEVLTFDEQDRVTRVEVYFGWDLPAR